MHKHLTSPAAQGARHEHRLKTTLLSKSTALTASAAQQQYSQPAASLSDMRLAGQSSGPSRTTTNTVRGSTAINASASAEFTYQQAWESVGQYYTQQPPQPADSPLRSSVGPTRPDVTAAAAVSTSPSKTRSGNAYRSGQQQQYSHPYAQQQDCTQQQLSEQQTYKRQYPVVPDSTTHEPNMYEPYFASGAAAGDATATSGPDVGETAAAAAAAAAVPVGGGTGYAARLFKSTGKTLRSEGQGSSSADSAPSAKAAGTTVAAAIPPAPKERSSSSSSSKQVTATAAAQPSEQPPQQQQYSHTIASSSFGVRLSGSVVAAINGWLVNQAVDAAAAAATAALSGSSTPAAATSSPAPAAAATAAAQQKHDSNAWSIGGFLRSSVSPQQPEQQQQQPEQSSQRLPKNAAAAAVAADTAPVEGSASGYLSYLAPRRVSRRSSSSDDDYDDSQEVAMQDIQLRSGSSSSDDDSAADAGLLSDEEPVPPAGARRRRAKSSVAAAAAAVARGWGSCTAAAATADAAGDSSFVVVGRPAIAQKVKALRGLLLWRSKGGSAKALGCGLYTVLLIGSIPSGLQYMQVTTLLPILALTYMAYNLTKPWAIRGYCKIRGSGDAMQYSARLAAFESAALDKAVALCRRAAAEAGQWMLAVVALAHRALRGEKFTTTVWTVLSLWLLLLVSELRIMSQTLLAMLAYGGLFCVPWLYAQFKHHIDTVVYDALHFLTLLVVHTERWAYLLAAVAAGLVWQMMEAEGGSMIVQGSAAALSGLAVLVWRVAVADT